VPWTLRLLRNEEVVMSHTFTLRVTQPSTGSETTVEGQFPDDEWEVLCRFAEYASDLLGTSMVKDGLHVTATLHFSNPKGVSSQVAIPPSDAVCAFLHRMRPFVLQDEPTSFYKTCSLIGRYICDISVRDMLKKLKSLYSGKDFQSQVRMDFHSLVNCEAALKKWLNAFEYHKDRSKQEEIQLLAPGLPLEYLKAIFLSMTLDMAKAVLGLSELVELLTDQDVVKGIPSV
jgi:hypothetical protein